MAFDGSANESANAYVDNFERVSVHQTVRASAASAENFDRLWENKTQGLEVVTFHEALRRGVIRPRKVTAVGESRSGM